MPVRLAPLDFHTAAIEDKTFTFTRRWRELLRLVIGDIESVSSLPAVINRKALTELNALGLGASDANYLAFETTTGHLLRWTGTAFEFAPGDKGNGFKEDRAFAPQDSAYWQLCDGSATTYLALGATLSLAAHTPPNLTGSPAFHKSIAAYTGTIEAAIAPAGSAVMSGSTASESTHTHGPGTLQTGDNDPTSTTLVDQNLDGTTVVVAGREVGEDHFHDVETGATAAGSAHVHAVGTLAAAITVDSAARPQSIGWLPYFRR